MGGVGDGLVAVKTGDKSAVRLSSQNLEFGNETHFIGSSPSSWTLEIIPPTKSRRIAVLGTDGVADDIRDENLDLFSIGFSVFKIWPLLFVGAV